MLTSSPYLRSSFAQDDQRALSVRWALPPHQPPTPKVCVCGGALVYQPLVEQRTLGNRLGSSLLWPLASGLWPLES
jgi:hypothetical protein